MGHPARSEFQQSNTRQNERADERTDLTDLEIPSLTCAGNVLLERESVTKMTVDRTLKSNN